MTKMIPIAVIAALTAGYAGAETTANIIPVAESPIELSKFRASYSQGGSYGREGVRYNIAAKNTTDRPIVAISVGFVAFDVFNESMGRGLNGVFIENIEPGETSVGTWNHTVLSAFMFEKWGSAYAYPSKVRFEDGSIWRVDPAQMVEKLQEIEEDFSVEDLTPED